MIKEILKSLGYRLIDIAGYLKISRPTLDLYIELYEAERWYDISEAALETFDYIENTVDITRQSLDEFLVKTFINPLFNSKEARLMQLAEQLARSKNIPDHPIVKKIVKLVNSDISKNIEIAFATGEISTIKKPNRKK